MFSALHSLLWEVSVIPSQYDPPPSSPPHLLPYKYDYMLFLQKKILFKSPPLPCDQITLLQAKCFGSFKIWVEISKIPSGEKIIQPNYNHNLESFYFWALMPLSSFISYYPHRWAAGWVGGWVEVEIIRIKANWHWSGLTWTERSKNRHPLCNLAWGLGTKMLQLQCITLCWN